MFELKSARPHRKGTMVLSVGLHVVLGSALVVKQLWAVAEPPEPTERISWVDFTPQVPQVPEEPVRLTRPPSPPKGNPQGGRPGAAPVRAVAPRVTQPPEIPPLLPAAPEVPAAEGDETDIGEPEPGDRLIGAKWVGSSDEPWGTRGGTRIYAASAPDVIAPVALSTPEPLYPEWARRARLQGTVVLEAVIGPDGIVRDVRVIKSLNAALDRLSGEAVLRWRYRPARIAERAVAVYLTVTITYGIR